MPALRLQLSEAEVERLRYERYAFPQPMIQKRLFAVYLNGTSQYTNPQIGCIVGLHPNSVRHWIKTYSQQGYEGLLANHCRGARSALDAHTDSILSRLKEEPPHSARQAQAHIQQICGIRRSTEQVRAFMKRHGLCFRKCGHVPAKADSQAQHRWVDEELQPAVEAAQRGRVHLLFLDAAHFMLQPFVCCLWCAARLFLRAACGRNRINVLGAVDAVSKKIVTLANTTYLNAGTLIEFLGVLKKEFIAKPIIIVLDNASYQHCRAVQQAAEAMGIRLLFLPPYSPNLNLIERVWRYAKTKILYGRYYDTPKKFHQAVEAFFENINSNDQTELNSLLTLKFQFFDQKNSQISPV